MYFQVSSMFLKRLIDPGTKSPESLHSTFGDHDGLYMRQPYPLTLRFELMLSIRPGLARPDQLLLSLSPGPRYPPHCHSISSTAALCGDLHAMRRVDHELLYLPWGAELDDGPVHMALCTRSGGLPSVAHVLASAREEKFALCTEVPIASGDGHCAILHGGEVEYRGLVLRKDGNGVTEQAEAGDTSIGVHVQPHVHVLLLGRLVELPSEPLRGSTLLHLEKHLPATLLTLLRCNLVIVLAETPLD
jgi:hypothetical protein